jgi:hypothetical protein
MSTRSRLLGLAAAAVLVAPAAQAASVKEIFEKYNLLGTFAWDCSKPAVPNNLYFVSRPVDDNRLQLDQMNGPTNRQYVMLINQATESKPGELTLIGTRNGEPISIHWRIEPDRVVRLEFSVGDRKLHTGGRYTDNGNEVPSLRRCGG